MKKIILALLLSISLKGYCQISFVDSMRAVAYKPLEDTNKSKAINILAVYYLTNNLDSAKHYGKLMMERAEKKGIKKMLARAYAYNGDVAAKNNNYADQITYLSKAIKLMEESKDIDGTIRITTRLSNVYLSINDNANALQHIQKSIDLLNTQDEKIKYNNLSRALTVLGEVYFKNNDPAAAMKHFKQANTRAIKEKLDDWYIAKTYENLAKTYAAQNDNKNANLYYTNALLLNKHLNNAAGVTSCKQGLAGLLINEDKTGSAFIEIKQGEDLAIKQKDILSLLKAYEQYILLYEREGNFKKKSEYQSMRAVLKDSINAMAFNNALADAKIKLRNEEKERENSLLSEKNKVLNLEIENTRNQVLLGIAVALCLVLGLLFRNSINKLKSQTKTMELENKLLRIQMNPHFIFNILSSIQSYVLSEDSVKASKYIAMFAKLMRKSLDNSRKEFTSFKDEVELLDIYVKLEKTRLKTDFDFSINFNPKETENISIPPMLIQPHIENALKHGIILPEPNNKIRVDFVLKGKHLFCKIEDNGVGINSSMSAKKATKINHTSAALELTKTRLELLCKNLKFPFTFDIRDIQESDKNRTGTIVEFLVPFIYETQSINS